MDHKKQKKGFASPNRAPESKGLDWDHIRHNYEERLKEEKARFDRGESDYYPDELAAREAAELKREQEVTGKRILKRVTKIPTAAARKIAATRRKITPFMVMEIEELYLKKKSYAEIEKKMNLTRNSIAAVLNDLGYSPEERAGGSKTKRGLTRNKTAAK